MGTNWAESSVSLGVSSLEAIIAITKHSIPSLVIAIQRATLDTKVIQSGLDFGGKGLGRIGR